MKSHLCFYSLIGKIGTLQLGLSSKPDIWPKLLLLWFCAQGFQMELLQCRKALESYSYQQYSDIWAEFLPNESII